MSNILRFSSAREILCSSSSRWGGSVDSAFASQIRQILWTMSCGSGSWGSVIKWHSGSGSLPFYQRHENILERQTSFFSLDLEAFVYFFLIVNMHQFNKGGFFIIFLFSYDIQHCYICCLSDYTGSEDDGIEPRTVATLAAFGIGSQML
jgi:hypothetical protein